MFFKSITYERPAFNFVDVRREKSEWGETEDNEERSIGQSLYEEPHRKRKLKIVPMK